MKKIVSLVAALTLVFAINLSVCAAPSVSKLPTATSPDVTVSQLPTGTTAGGAEATIKNTSSQYTRQAVSVLAAVAGISAEEAKTYTPIATFDVSAKETGNITFNIAGVKATDAVIVLHKCSQHGYDWEKLPASAGNGTVTATFHSFSPVVIFVKAGAASPKTADASMTTAALVAMIAVAGLVISKKKFA